jgi:diaminohydroxyphosphoribosylaminopyrimidine deaminase/5-amino-6-(5-phosphoribosylamino)uracil reductase
VVVEGGGRLLGLCLDSGQIDEAHVFIAPRVIGGADAPSPVAGAGAERLTDALKLDRPQWRALGDDLYGHGRIARNIAIAVE